MENTQTFPDWLNDLFLRFSNIYGAIWTYDLSSEKNILAKKIEWFGPLSYFGNQVIQQAIEACKIAYSKPPSIKEFYDLCVHEKNNVKREHDKNKRIEFNNVGPSELLAEYMAKNPFGKDDIFKGIDGPKEMFKVLMKKMGCKNVPRRTSETKCETQ